jgi:hypothetical protein
VRSFDQLQSDLGHALRLNKAGSGQEHVVIALPSYSLGETLLAHYAPRLPALEHRYLLAATLLGRIESAHFVFVGSQDPGPDVVDHYVSLADPALHGSIRRRLTCVTLDDASPRSVAAKLLDAPEDRDRIATAVAGRPAFIEPWNVTEQEVALAELLQLPVNGTSPALRHLAFKSNGRRLLRAAGVPVPFGFEDVRTVADVVAAARRVQDERPGCQAVVVKHDDSGAGDGNVVLSLGGDDLELTVRALPDWYLADLTAGGIVEERITGEEFRSPSAQVDVRPDGGVDLIATHEQDLGGPDDQVYLGCRFPAAAEYAGLIGRHAVATGAELARHGVVGRVAVDFAVARREGGDWDVRALEINLRKGGTTHPYAALRNLVPGRYDADDGCWYADRDGAARAYQATDNLVDPAWLGLRPRDVIGVLRRRGIAFDRTRGEGVVPHMLSCLAIDGRFGLTAVGRDADHAADLVQATREAVGTLA